MTNINITALSNEELLGFVYLKPDTTSLERELALRLGNALDEVTALEAEVESYEDAAANAEAQP